MVKASLTVAVTFPAGRVPVEMGVGMGICDVDVVCGFTLEVVEAVDAIVVVTEG